MLSQALGISDWDPLGLTVAAPAAAGSVHAKLEASRAQLHALKCAVSGYLDRVSTTPIDESDSSDAMVQALNAAATEHEEQEELHQREVMGTHLREHLSVPHLRPDSRAPLPSLIGLRQTVTLLQADHRKRLTALTMGEGSRAPAPSASAAAVDARGQETALRLKAETEMERLQAALRTSEEALAAEKCATATTLEAAREGDRLAIAEGKSAETETAALWSARERATGDLEARLRQAAARAEAAEAALSRERHQAAQKAATGAEELRAAIARGAQAAAASSEVSRASAVQWKVAVAVMAAEVGLLERWKAGAAETHAREVATTRDRVEKMLVSKDSEIAMLRRKTAATVVGNGGNHACNGHGKGEVGGMPSAAVFEGAGWTESDNPTSLETNGSGQAAPDSSATLSAAAAAAFGGEGDGAARLFASRIVELEREISRLRDRDVEREAGETHARILKARLAKLQRANAQLRGGAPDPELAHNVLFKYLLMPSAERNKLLPMLSALFDFRPKEIAQIQRANDDDAAPGAIGWLFGAGSTRGSQPASTGGASAAGVRDSSGVRRGGASHSESRTNAGGACGGDVDALRAKVQRLRWLLKCANEEIVRQRGQKGGTGLMSSAGSGERD